MDSTWVVAIFSGFPNFEVDINFALEYPSEVKLKLPINNLTFGIRSF